MQERKVCSLRRTLRPAPEVDYWGMRKHLFTPTPLGIRPDDAGWLDLDRAATVEVTSEEKDYGIDAALVSGETQGWRAAESGTQTIRLIFDEPQRLTRISLVFEETDTERTQEFILRWSPDGGHSFQRIGKTKFHFEGIAALHRRLRGRSVAVGMAVRPAEGKLRAFEQNLD